MDRIRQHAFSRELMDASTPLLKRVLGRRPHDSAEIEAWRVANRASMSISERYTWSVLGVMFAFHRVIERERAARTLILVSPARLRGTSGKLDRADWIEYHLSAHAVALTSLSDLCLHLTNRVYQLGLAPRYCKLDVITSNASISRTPIAKKLRALEKVLGDQKQRRNRYLHQGDEADIGSFTDAGFALDLKGLSVVQRVQPSPEIANILRQGWRWILRDLKPVLDAAAEAATEAVLPCFDAVHPRFTLTLAALQRAEA